MAYLVDAGSYNSSQSEGFFHHHDMFRTMMGWGGQGSFYWVFPLITWLLLVIGLMVFIRWLWLKGNQEQKSKK
jgi:uncharacterized membrane protein